MTPQDYEFFKNLLLKMKEEILNKGENTLEDLTEEVSNYADPTDRATAETDRAFTLRLRDRDLRLIKKIDAALARIEDGTFGICEECGEEIGMARLKARPVTTLCIHCKSKQEEQEALLK